MSWGGNNCFVHKRTNIKKKTNKPVFGYVCVGEGKEWVNL